jgi:hypothetical protein
VSCVLPFKFCVFVSWQISFACLKSDVPFTWHSILIRILKAGIWMKWIYIAIKMLRVRQGVSFSYFSDISP